MEFHYNVVPKAGNSGFSTRVGNPPDLTPEELIASVARETGLTADQVAAAGTALFRGVILAAADSRKVRNLFGLFTFLPRCGGSFTNVDFQPTADSLNVGINGNLTPDGLHLFTDGMTFVRDGVEGAKVPIIERVYDATTRGRDKCTPGGGFKIGGQAFWHFDDVPANVGVYLQPATGGSKVRVASYISWKDSEISGVWPAGLAGSQTLTVETTYANSGSVRNSTYTQALSA